MPRKRAVKAKEAEPVVEPAAESDEDEENEDTVADLKAAVPSEVEAFRKLFADAQVILSGMIWYLNGQQAHTREQQQYI